jgi:hypothetical protein
MPDSQQRQRLLLLQRKSRQRPGKHVWEGCSQGSLATPFNRYFGPRASAKSPFGANLDAKANKVIKVAMKTKAMKPVDMMKNDGFATPMKSRAVTSMMGSPSPAASPDRTEKKKK